MSLYPDTEPREQLDPLGRDEPDEDPQPSPVTVFEIAVNALIRQYGMSAQQAVDALREVASRIEAVIRESKGDDDGNQNVPF